MTRPRPDWPCDCGHRHLHQHDCPRCQCTFYLADVDPRAEDRDEYGEDPDAWYERWLPDTTGKR